MNILSPQLVDKFLKQPQMSWGQQTINQKPIRQK